MSMENTSPTPQGESISELSETPVDQQISGDTPFPVDTAVDALTDTSKRPRPGGPLKERPIILPDGREVSAHDVRVVSTEGGGRAYSLKGGEIVPMPDEVESVASTPVIENDTSANTIKRPRPGGPLQERPLTLPDGREVSAHDVRIVSTESGGRAYSLKGGEIIPIPSE